MEAINLLVILFSRSGISHDFDVYFVFCRDWYQIAKMDENMRMLSILTASSVLEPIRDQLVFLLGQDLQSLPAC